MERSRKNSETRDPIPPNGILPSTARPCVRAGVIVLYFVEVFELDTMRSRVFLHVVLVSLSCVQNVVMGTECTEKVRLNCDVTTSSKTCHCCDPNYCLMTEAGIESSVLSTTSTAPKEYSTTKVTDRGTCVKKYSTYVTRIMVSILVGSHCDFSENIFRAQSLRPIPLNCALYPPLPQMHVSEDALSYADIFSSIRYVLWCHINAIIHTWWMLVGTLHIRTSNNKQPLGGDRRFTSSIILFFFFKRILSRRSR